MENSDLNLNSNNLKNITFNSTSLILSKSHSLNDVFSCNNETYNINKIEDNKSPILNSYKQIPDNRMEHYLNEYYNNLYNTIYYDKKQNLNKRKINTNQGQIPSIFSSLAVSPINSNQQHMLYENKNNSNYNNIEKIKDNNKINDNLYEKENNKISNKIFNIPEDLLIEYNNGKRLMELRNKYLSNSSLILLKNNNDINENINNFNNNINLKNDIIYNNHNNRQKDINDNNLNDKQNVSKINNNNKISKLEKLEINNYENIKEIIYDNNKLDNNNNNSMSSKKYLYETDWINEKNFNNDFNKESKSLKTINNIELSKEFKSILSSNNINSDINNENNQNNDKLMNIIMEIQNKYNTLQNDFKILNEKSKNSLKEKDIYKNHLIEENNKLKIIIDKYEIVLGLLLSYINEINNFFNLREIEYFYLKQNIKNNTDDYEKSNYFNELSLFLKKCKDNIIYENENNKLNEINLVMNDENKNYNNYNNEELNLNIIKRKINKVDKNLYNKNSNNKSKDNYEISDKNQKKRLIKSCESKHNKRKKSSINNELMNKNKNIFNFTKKKKKNKNKIFEM